jgi:kinetochore protein Spc24, fungi type
MLGNSKKKDVHVVNIESKYSRFFYANYLWDLL